MVWGISIPLWFDCEQDNTNVFEADVSFQFHYGSIVSADLPAMVVEKSDFNSTMVRL